MDGLWYNKGTFLFNSFCWQLADAASTYLNHMIPIKQEEQGRERTREI